jgi:hypothetical protein
MTHIEAMKQALEAFCFMPNEIVTQRGVQVAMSSLRQAIAEADHIEQHLEMPVAWFTGRFWTDAAHGRNLCEVVHNAIPIAGAPLYTHPQPKREFVGLTNEEINKLRYKKDWTAPWTDMTFALAIEAKLKEKNGYAEEKNT